MKTGGIAFRREIAFALLGQNVHQHRAIEVPHVLEGADEAIETVALDGADVVKIECLEQHARREERYQHVFAAPQQVYEIRAQAGNGFEEILELPPQIHERLVGQFAAQKRG